MMREPGKSRKLEGRNPIRCDGATPRREEIQNPHFDIGVLDRGAGAIFVESAS
jgi:hypothetical protein